VKDVFNRMGIVVAAVVGWELGGWGIPLLEAYIGGIGVGVVLVGLVVVWLWTEGLWPFNDQAAWRNG
jgi:hypothetical protein